MVGRLSTLLFEGAIFGRWRSSWTIPRTRRPRTRYDDAATATIGWNRIHPDLPYTILHSCIHTYMHAYMIIPDVSQMEEEIHTYILLAPMHTSTYVIYAHVHAAYSSVCMYACVYYDIKAVSAWGMQGHQTECIFYKRSWWWCNTWIYGVCGSSFSLGLVVCMYVCMYVCIYMVSFDNYFDSFSLSRIVWEHSAHRIRLLGSQRGGGSPAAERRRDRSPERCKEMRRR